MLKTLHFILIKAARVNSHAPQRQSKTQKNTRHEGSHGVRWYPLPSHEQRESLHQRLPLTPACLRGGVVLRGRFSHKQQRLKTKRRGTKKHVEVTVWAQTGAAEVCERGRSVGQSVTPSPGREGAASSGDSPSLSGQRHYAAVSVEQWSHPPITPNSTHFLHRDIYCKRHAGQRCFTCCHSRYNLIRHKLDSRSFSEPTKMCFVPDAWTRVTHEGLLQSIISSVTCLNPQFTEIVSVDLYT